MRHYLVTFKYNTKSNPTAEDYMDYTAEMLKRLKQCVVIANAYERDSKGKLHFHVIVATRYVHFKPFSQYCFDRGMYFNFQELKTPHSIIRAKHYLTKAPTNKYELEQQEASECSEYLFKLGS